jgi:hypothetical protein
MPVVAVMSPFAALSALATFAALATFTTFAFVVATWSAPADVGHALS